MRAAAAGQKQHLVHAWSRLVHRRVTTAGQSKVCMKGLLILQSAQNHPPSPNHGNSYKLVPVDALQALYWTAQDTFLPLDPEPTNCTELYTHSLCYKPHTGPASQSPFHLGGRAHDHPPPAVPAPPFCACPHRRRSPPVHPNPASSRNKHTLCILIVRTH